MFLELPDPDPLVRGMDPDPDPAPDPDFVPLFDFLFVRNKICSWSRR
jgi:hypothetical protein